MVLLFLAALFLLTLGALAFLGKLPIAVLSLYLGASTVAFFAYLFDKSAAKNGQWRTPENTLHLLGVIGGWPGALIAQQLLRHKTKKLSFRVVFWASVLINLAAMIWLFSTGASSTLRSLL